MKTLANIGELVLDQLPKSEFSGKWSLRYLKSVGRIACTNTIACGEGNEAHDVEFTIQVGIDDKFNLSVLKSVKLTGKSQRDYYFARQYQVKDYLIEYFSNPDNWSES